MPPAVSKLTVYFVSSIEMEPPVVNSTVMEKVPEMFSTSFSNLNFSVSISAIFIMRLLVLPSQPESIKAEAGGFRTLAARFEGRLYVVDQEHHCQ